MASDEVQLSWWKRQRYRLEGAAIQSLMRIIPRLSYWEMRYVAGAMGAAGYFCLAGARRIAMANLDVAFGDSLSRRQKRIIARRSIENFGMAVATSFWMRNLTHRNVRDMVSWNEADFEKLRDLRRDGRGILFVAPHYGNWEFLGMLYSQQGFPITTPVEQVKNPAVSERLNEMRSVTGIRIVPQRFGGIKVLKALKRGECSLLLVDHNATSHGGAEWVDFFGLPVPTNAAIAALALRANAAVIPTASLPIERGRMRVLVGEEIRPEPGLTEQQAIHDVSQKCLSYCEQIIRNDPRWWLWTYKRWKRRLTHEQGRYPFYSRPDRSLRSRTGSRAMDV